MRNDYIQMKTYNYKAFVFVAREGNLTRAAKRLFLTQSALSLQIKKLQEQLNLVLFERTPHGMRLTEAGQRLLPAAERALQAEIDFSNEAAGLDNAVSGRLRLGTILDPEFLRLGDYLSLLTKRHPALMLELTHGMSGTVAELVKNDQLDVAFTLGPPDLEDLSEQYHLIKLREFSYRVIAPLGWRSRVEGMNWESLAKLPWIGTPPNSVHNQLLSKKFASIDARQNIVASVDLEQSMMNLVLSGVGLSLARHSHALHASHTHGVVIADKVSLDAGLCFICRKDWHNNPSITAAMTAVEDIWLNNK